MGMPATSRFGIVGLSALDARTPYRCSARRSIAHVLVEADGGDVVVRCHQPDAPATLSSRLSIHRSISALPIPRRGSVVLIARTS